MHYISHCASPLGEILLASDGLALTGAWFEGQQHYARGLNPLCQEQPLPVFGDAAQWLDIYFSGKVPDFLPPLRLIGTDFQKELWQILIGIPRGQTMTYGQIAAKLAAQRGLPHMSAQAVGNAVGRNPLSVFVPCHRVLGKDGTLTGYAGGLDRKIALLRLEGTKYTQ